MTEELSKESRAARKAWHVAQAIALRAEHIRALRWVLENVDLSNVADARITRRIAELESIK